MAGVLVSVPLRHELRSPGPATRSVLARLLRGEPAPKSGSRPLRGRGRAHAMRHRRPPPRRFRGSTGARSCHRPAAFRACPAFLGALTHVTDLVAALGTRLADLRTQAADPTVQWRVAQHEVGRGLAHFGAVEHQAKVLLLDVAPTLLKAIRHRHPKAHAVAVEARLDRLLHGGGHAASARRRRSRGSRDAPELDPAASASLAASDCKPAPAATATAVCNRRRRRACGSEPMSRPSDPKLLFMFIFPCWSSVNGALSNPSA